MCGHPSGLNQSVSSPSFAVLPAEIIHFSIRALPQGGSLLTIPQTRHINKAYIFVNIGKPRRGHWEGTFWNMNILWINHCVVYLAILHRETWWSTRGKFALAKKKKKSKKNLPPPTEILGSTETKINDERASDPPPYLSRGSMYKISFWKSREVGGEYCKMCHLFI